MNRSLFARFSLANDEWPVCRLLNQRARNFAMFPRATRPATVFLDNQGKTRVGRDLGAEIEALDFDRSS
jgi:hypothetical protein